MKNERRNTIKSIAGFLAGLICVCAVVLGTVPLVSAEDVTSGNSPGAESTLLSNLRSEIVAYMEKYQLSPEMPDQALANAYFALDSQSAESAWVTANLLLEQAQELNAEEADILLSEKNTKLCLRFYNIMAESKKPMLLADAVYPFTPTGDASITCTSDTAPTDDWDSTTGVLKVKVTGVDQGCSTTEAATQSVTISCPADKTLTFSLSTTDVNQITSSNTGITTTGGDKTLQAGTAVTFTITTGENTTENILTLSNFKLSDVKDSYNVTVNYDNSFGSVTIGDATVNSGTVQEVADGNSITVVATPNSTSKFLAWVDTSTYSLLSSTASYTFTPGTDVSVTALFSSATSAAWFKVGSRYFNNLNNAGSYATSSGTDTIILVADGTLPADDYTIPSGITLLIPFDGAHTLITDNMADNISEDNSEKELYRQLTMKSGSNISVEGAICVGSKAYKQMTGQVGPYGAIVMDSGSSITVKEGGILYAYGYIFAGDGSGTVTVENKGTVYEDLMVMDYPGRADYTQSLYDASAFPMRAFTVRNVEVPMTLKYGAKEYVFYHFYGTNPLVGYNGENVLLIGETSTDNPSPFSLESGTELTKSYVNGKQIIRINGDSSINSITLKIKKLAEVSTSETSGFPIPSGFDITIASGTLTMGDNVIMTEGSKITIAYGAELNTNQKNLYVLDATEDAGTNSGTDVHDIVYTVVDTDAVLDVNGTLKASGGFYTSTSGAAIISSEGTGVIEFTGSSSETEVKIRTGGQTNTPSTCAINSAWLKNSDASFVKTGAPAVSPNTYTYIDGFWRCGTHSYTSVTVDPTCTEAGSTTYTCSVCGHSYSEPIAATGHSYTPVVTDPTCTEQGYTTYTCACGDSYVSDITASLGHEWQEDGTCVRDCVAIASVNGQMYLSVAEALEAVPVGGTIKLLYAPAATDTPAFNKSVTVNKNGLDYEIVCADGWDDVDNGDDTWTVQKVSDGDKFHIYAANVNMGNNLDMLFAIPKDAVTDWTGHYVQIVRTGSAEASEDETVDVKFAEWVENGSFYIITYGGFDAKEMCDSITLTVYNSEGTAVSYPWTDSIRAYAMRILGISDDDRQKTVAVDMLNFGAEAQKHLNYGTEKLANALLSDAQKALASGGNPVSDDLDEGSNFEGGNLIVTSHIQYALVFKGQTSEMTAKIEYTGHKGNTFSEIVTISNLNGTECFVVPGFVVADARYPITITVYNEDDSEYTTCVDSIEAYISRKAADSPVFAAFMKFADSAHAFKHEGKYE